MFVLVWLTPLLLAAPPGTQCPGHTVFMTVHRVWGGVCECVRGKGEYVCVYVVEEERERECVCVCVCVSVCVSVSVCV